MAALLGAVVNKAVFADVKIAGTGSTLPVVDLSTGQILLKPVDARVAARGFVPFDLLIDASLSVRKGLQASRMIVNDAKRTGESKDEGSLRDRQGILRI